MKRLAYVIGLSLALFLVTTQVACSRSYNGFDVSDALIPVAQIHLGGPPRDGIPAIDEPRFVQVAGADFLKPNDPVLGLALSGVAKAYPIAIINWHEIVNDRLGTRPVAITFCPLCGTGVAFDADAAGKSLQFGVSGLLYNSDVLLYDRETESLWSQLLMKAVSGPLKGRKLDPLPLSHTSWSDWREEHPNTLVLSTDTGYRRDYGRNPYAGYEREKGLYFPVSSRSARFHPKERVLGVEVGGAFKAYPFAELSRTRGEVQDRLNGKRLTIRFDEDAQSAKVFDGQGRQLPAVTAFWFAWYAFHPETGVYQANRR